MYTGWDHCYCYPGFVSVDGTDNKSPCTQCPEGLFTSNSGMRSCDVCKFGYYSSSGKSSFAATDTQDCQMCPVGSTTTRLGSHSVDQCICDKDYYRLHINIITLLLRLSLSSMIAQVAKRHAACVWKEHGQTTRNNKQPVP